MTVYSFAVKWPVPFNSDWQTSSRDFVSTDGAGKALSEYLAISADNGTILDGRLVVFANGRP